MNRRRFDALEPARVVGPGDARRFAAAKEREEERWKRARAIGIIGTAILHFLLLLLFRSFEVPPSAPTSAAGPPLGDVRPSGGGSGLTMVEVRPETPPPPREQVPEPVPVPVPTPVEVVVPEEVVPPTTIPDPGPVAPPTLAGTGGPGTGGQDGPAVGRGTANGDGDGGGGDSDGGASRIVPPTPRGIFIPPPGRPASARGQEITVWVFVSESGRVDRSTVRLEPPTSDSRYNQRLIQSVAEWVFDPARQGGRPVSTWYPFQIIL